MSNIRFVKLITGEDLIADIKIGKENQITMKNPVRIMLTAQGVAMAPYAPFSKSDDIKIGKENVLFDTDLEDEVYSAYNEKFGSGIVIATPSIKLVD